MPSQYKEEVVKYCNKCDKIKNESEFGKDKYKSDGLNPYCKECIKKRSAEQRKSNSEYHREYAEKYRNINREVLRKKSAERYKIDKEKYLSIGRESYYRNQKEIAKRRKIRRNSAEARNKEAERQKKWRNNNKELYQSYIKKWQQGHREKHNAHQKVHRAIVKGILVRNMKCENCGIRCKTEGHHEDYSKPLEVIWLCRKCHASKIETVEVTY